MKDSDRQEQRSTHLAAAQDSLIRKPTCLLNLSPAKPHCSVSPCPPSIGQVHPGNPQGCKLTQGTKEKDQDSDEQGAAVTALSGLTPDSISERNRPSFV